MERQRVHHGGSRVVTPERSASASAATAPREACEPAGVLQRLPVTCRHCGRGAHPETPGKCENNHFLAGHRLTQRASSDWAEDAQALEELVAALLRDEGTDVEHAPRKLLLTVRGIAQAERVATNAYA